VDVAYLVCVHEAGIAHHVATVGEIDGEYRAASVANRARSVAVQVFVVVSRNVAAREVSLDPFEELRVDGHQVFKFSVNGALLHHPDLAIAFDNLRFDFAHLFVDEVSPIFRAIKDQIARLADAIGTERVRLARPAERGLGFLPRLEHRLFGPLRSEGRVGTVLIEELNRVESDARGLAERPIKGFPELIPNRLRHYSPTSSI